MTQRQGSSTVSSPLAPGRQRRRFRVAGVVQGVGFRPFVYVTATSLGLTGEVSNDSAGVVVEVEGAGEEHRTIRWGTVTGVDGEPATVVSEPLTVVGGALRLGAPREESVRWSAGGTSLVRNLTDGDLVSLHWDWVCDRLDAERVAALQHWSKAGTNTLELR